MTDSIFSLAPRHTPSVPLPGDEPAFRVDGERGVRLPAALRDRHTARYLAQRVVRNPGDLHAHVQRIHLHLDLKDGDGTNAALTDLFIALGAGGGALRQRLLAVAAPLLTAELHDALEAALTTPLEPRTALSHGAGAVLTRGLTGSCQLVEQVVAQSRGGAGDALVEADELLQEGQLEAATRVLEEALATTPERGDIQSLLLDIYRRTRDVRRFHASCDRLRSSGQPLPEEWLELADELSGAVIS